MKFVQELGWFVCAYSQSNKSKQLFISGEFTRLTKRFRFEHLFVWIIKILTKDNLEYFTDRLDDFNRAKTMSTRHNQRNEAAN